MTEPRVKVAVTCGYQKSGRRPPVAQGIRTWGLKLISVYGVGNPGIAMWAMLSVPSVSDGLKGLKNGLRGACC